MAQLEIHLDTLFLVMEHLDLNDGLSCMMVCKEWFQLDRFEMVWKTLLSNWLLFKIHDYQQLMESYPKTSEEHKIYKSLLNITRKFHTTQILNEKKVNKSSFMEYMEKDMDDERSVIFGSRFKKLIPSALNTNFSIMMSKGLEEMTKDFQDSIVNYSHTGVVAQYFLSNAKKFTKDGRVMQGLRAQEYWKRFSKSMFNLAIVDLPTEDVTLEYMRNFKPILDDSAIINYIYECRSNENLLNFIKEYISIDENVEKSSDPSKISLSMYELASESLLGLECWFDCMEILYPGMSETIFDYNLQKNGKRNRMSYLESSPTFEHVKKYCEIVRVKKVDLFSDYVSQIIRDNNDYELIQELYNHGMIDKKDIKRLLHTHSFYEANPMILIRMLKDFDPYEVFYLEGEISIPCHFVKTFFRSYLPLSYFTDFYNEYGPFDLERLLANMDGIDKATELDEYKQDMHSSARSDFCYSTPSKYLDFLETVPKYFKQQLLDVEIIEFICSRIVESGYQSDKEKMELLATTMKLIPVRTSGLSFEEYCQAFYTKYPDCGASLDFVECKENFEERMALLYHCCRAFITQEISTTEPPSYEE